MHKRRNNGSNSNIQEKDYRPERGHFQGSFGHGSTPGYKLEKLIENLLDKTAEEYDDSEAYRYMTENYPDGKVKLDKNERKEFMDWLGVVEK